MVDRFIKMAHFIALKERVTASDIAKAFLKNVWKIHGLPTEIVSDRDTKFTGEFWTSLCTQLNIKLSKSSAYHPQTEGQTEPINQTLEAYLRNIVNYDQNDWYDFLPLTEYAYNNVEASATGNSPVFARHGFHPRMSWTIDKEFEKSCV